MFVQNLWISKYKNCMKKNHIILYEYIFYFILLMMFQYKICIIYILTKFM
jgi:hypothetical protein